jgi:carboxypeptidase Q
MARKSSALSAAILLCGALPSIAGDKHKSAAPAAVDPYTAIQPVAESLDLKMYQRIRDEGLNHSHVMELASALADGIGPRLTGSPNLKKANDWTRDTLTKIGLENAHLEDWGEFGIGWQQLNTWACMVTPDTAVLIVQAAPWSPATPGPITAHVVSVKIESEKDLDQYRGKLAGKIVLDGPPRDVPPVDHELSQRYTAKELDDLVEKQVNGGEEQKKTDAFLSRIFDRNEMVAQFLADEKVVAVVEPSRDGDKGGGSGGTLYDDRFTGRGWKPDYRVKIPVVVAAIESYGRLYRLTQARVPVTAQIDVETKFTGDHEHGFNTIAEIPGTDPKLKNEVVMLGGHLDSWIAGTGATDNGAGAVVAMEAVRILKALAVQPRRTIRITLWTGEEQGELGSGGYVRQHFGSALDGVLTTKPEYKLVSAYFNLDNGGGRIRGVFLQGNAAAAPILAQWIAPLKDLGVTTVAMADSWATDHMRFDEVGIPGFQFIQDGLDYGSRSWHTNQDVYERLQPADLKQIATVEAIFVYNAAMRDQMLPRKHLRDQLEKEEPGAPLIASAAPGQVPSPPKLPEEQIRSLLQEMDAAANAHDTDRFMAPFLHSDKLVVINGEVIHGWDALREQQQKWWLNGKSDVVYTPQSDPEFMVLNSDLVAVTRVFTSNRTAPDGGTARSNFAVSMIWQQTPHGWRIVYDHESRSR